MTVSESLQKNSNNELQTKNREVTVYIQAVRNYFSFLKNTQQFDDLIAKSITLKGAEGYLVPVAELHAADQFTIEQLAKWRHENQHFYPSQFPVTVEGTTKWLRSKLLDVEDRMLFLVTDKYGKALGHLGYANGLNHKMEIEVDNVLRGIKDANPGIMSAALQTLLDWVQEFIAPQQIYLRVFKDNEHAIKYYHRLGFVDDYLIPMRKHLRANGIVEHLPVEAGDTQQPDKYYLRMNYKSPRKENGAEIILTAGPSISAREVSYTLDAVKNGWNHHMSDYLEKFEKGFADYLGAKYVMSTSSCTGGLHIAMLALGIGPGDEVIVPDITWVASANAAMYVGATPIFADVDINSWCLDPASFEALITPRTKAVVPVHLYGHPAEMDKITAIARKHNLFIVEDAAPAMGAECRGKKVGNYGDFAAFSFQGAKLAVTGEGGMLVTNNEELYKKAYAIWDQGRTPGTFWINELGYKYKMSNLQAALGLGQLERVEDLIAAKRRIYSWYSERLQDCSAVKLNQEMSWARSICWMTSILVDAKARISRDQLRTELKKRNVDTRPIFPAISQYPHWPKKQLPQPISEYIGKQGINLPSGVCLQEAQIDYICRCIKDIVGN